MQNDDVIWGIINKSFCSFKVNTKTHKFCRNEYNLTGLCSRVSCPLANSQYATVREENGIAFLYMKTIERAAFPNKMWEKVKLSRNFQQALAQINENLIFWPNYIRQKCKQRLVKITQYLIRMRKLRLKNTKKLVPIQRKIERRETRREAKALVAARIDNVIEQQLLDRLEKGVYGDIYNFPKLAFDKAIQDEEELESENEAEEAEMEVEEEQEFAEGEDRIFVAAEDFEESDISDIEESEPLHQASDSDIEEIDLLEEEEDEPSTTANLKKVKGRRHKAKARVEIEYEMETEELPRKKLKN